MRNLVFMGTGVMVVDDYALVVYEYLNISHRIYYYYYCAAVNTFLWSMRSAAQLLVAHGSV